MTGLPILTYHSIDATGSIVSVAPMLFARQMAHLAAEGWQTLTFVDAVRRLREGDPIPVRHVVLTFDDAYRNVYTEAFPILQDHGFTATVFAISDMMGAHNDWPGHEPPMGRLPIMRWEEAAEMQRYGVEIAAHTCTHPDLTRVSASVADREMSRSKTEIEERLGKAVTTFAYPYGSVDPSVGEIARHLFEGACTTRMGRVLPGHDPLFLSRIDVYYFRRPSLFLNLPSQLLDPVLWGHQRLRSLRSLWN